MGYIGDQLCFHPLVFHTVFHCCIQSLSYMINIFCHLLLFTGKLFCRNLVLKFSICDSLQPFQNQLSSPGFLQKPIKYCPIQDHQKNYSQWTASSQPYSMKKKFHKYKYPKQKNHFDPASKVLAEQFPCSAEPSEDFFTQNQQMPDNTVSPERSCFYSPHQTEPSDQKPYS